MNPPTHRCALERGVSCRHQRSFLTHGSLRHRISTITAYVAFLFRRHFGSPLPYFLKTHGTTSCNRTTYNSMQNSYHRLFDFCDVSTTWSYNFTCIWNFSSCFLRSKRNLDLWYCSSPTASHSNHCSYPSSCSRRSKYRKGTSFNSMRTPLLAGWTMATAWHDRPGLIS
ncbi:hypothetical protein MM817_03199 [Acidibacillus sp. S0AB]|uniref:Uncharacterized protein n=1 Tax=Sulfoacidibacillus ferrooxidans TaxID=2005001 RepID=A0A9X2AFX0_9BACL|nr:hypothetical protein [Sulfoacidibacillus ferrooxidans]